MVKQPRKHRIGGLPVTCLRFCPDEQHVCFCGGADGKVQACSTIDGTCSDIVSGYAYNSLGTLVIQRDTQHLSAVCFMICCIYLTEPGNEINCLDFCYDGTNFATGGKDLDIRIYDTTTNKVDTIIHTHRIFPGEPKMFLKNAKRCLLQSLAQTLY